MLPHRATSPWTRLIAYPSALLLLLSTTAIISAMPTREETSAPLYSRAMPDGSTNATICSNLNTVQDLWVAVALPNTSIAFLRNRDQVPVDGSMNGTVGYQGQGKCIVATVNDQIVVGYASPESFVGLFTLDATGNLTEQKMFKAKRQQRVDTPTSLALGFPQSNSISFYAYSRSDGVIRIGGESDTITLPATADIILDMAVDGHGSLWILNQHGALHTYIPRDPAKVAGKGGWQPVSVPIPGAVQMVPTDSGVAVIAQNTTAYFFQHADINISTGTNTISFGPPTVVAPPPASTTNIPIFGHVDNTVLALSKSALTQLVPPLMAPPPMNTPAAPLPQPPIDSSASKGLSIGAIAGIVAAACLVLFAVILLLLHRRRQQHHHHHHHRQGGQARGMKKSMFGFKSKKARHLFPPSQRDDMATAPLGLYTDHHTEQLRKDGADYHMDSLAPPNGAVLGMHQQDRGSYVSGRSMDSQSSNMDEHMLLPLTARMQQHQDHNQTSSPHQLRHAVSISAMAPRFARMNAQSGLRFEEKVQLQVIRYEDSDAASISPHLPVGSLVLGAYHITRPPRSARPLKVLMDDASGQALGIVRSGTVFVRKSRLGPSQLSCSQTLVPSGPIGMNGEDSSMLLTEVENQHTFEVQTLKWYMTETHWKREAALLKHLKSPIFIMELLASYCIPLLQYHPSTYPFVNALGGCSRLLSEIGPMRTPQHARSVLRSVSAAVDWCHQRGVVHLNIQPGSFFVEDGIDAEAEDASWKLWDFTCARFIGEQVGVIGGGGAADASGKRMSLLPPPGQPPLINEELYEQQQLLICGNPLPACYTAPELLEAWREGRTTALAEASMDSWSLGCLYYEILTGRPLFRTEADAWALVGGWDCSGPRQLQDFRVPYPPPVRSGTSSPAPGSSNSSSSSSTEATEVPVLDPTGAIVQLMHDLLAAQPAKRLLLSTTMERIY